MTIKVRITEENPGMLKKAIQENLPRLKEAMDQALKECARQTFETAPVDRGVLR